MKLTFAIAVFCALVAFATADLDLLADNRLERLVDEILMELEAESDNDLGGSCGTADGYPICCPGRWIDPDYDGWGWQDDSFSCRVVSGVSGKPKRGGGGGGSPGGSSGGQCPQINCPSGISCGCYLESGLGHNKVAYLKAGANVDFLASAMLETNKMDAKSYAFGDNKSGDAFNAGATKMNWGMIRKCHPAYRKYGSGSYKVAAALNGNKKLDVQVYKECRKHFGGKWLSGHRNGETGLRNPNTPDIKKFQRGYEWTKKMLLNHPETQRNDVRFWVSINAI